MTDIETVTWQQRLPRGNRARLARLLTTTALVSLAASSLAYADDPVGSAAASPGIPPAQGSMPLELPAVSVEGISDSGYVTSVPSYHKLTAPLVDTPQSITVVPKQLIEDQGLTTLRDTLRNVPGISLAAGEAASQGDNLTLRGFGARNDLYLDGINDFGSYYRDPFNLESVEVLKGPSSVLFGRGSTGGVVNQVSKQPLLDPFIAGTVAFGSDVTRRATVDVNQPLPGLAQGAALRINLMGTAANVADRGIAENRRFGIAPTLALGLGTPTRITIGYFHQTEADIPDYGMPWLDTGPLGTTVHPPAPLPRQNYYGFKTGNYLRANTDIGTVKVEHDFSDAITVRDQLRYANYTRTFQITEPQMSPQITPLGTPLSALSVARNQLAGNSAETLLQNQLDGTFRFAVGGFNNTVVAGIELGRETSDPTRLTYTGVPETPLLNPTPRDLFAGTYSFRSIVKTTALTQGVYALDTIDLSPQWQLIGGIRWDRFDARYSDAVAGVAFQHASSLPTYRAAVVYKPLPNGSIYFAYGTSFDPSAESLSLNAATAPLPPERSRTFELGSKWDLFSKRLTVRGALYRTEKVNAKEVNPDDDLTDILAGNQRADGFELETAGHLTEKWQIYAGYSFIEGRVESSPDPEEVGHSLANVPKHTFNLWTTYELPYHFQIGGGVNYVATRYASSRPDRNGYFRSVPGYWTAQAMVGYHINDKTSIQANIYNITNTFYYDQIHPQHAVPGAGRTVLVTLNYRL